MTATRFLRIATASALACAGWLLLAYGIAESHHAEDAVIFVLCTLCATAASSWLLGILVERDDRPGARAGGDRSLRAQVAVMRALRATRGAATRADVFMHVAERDDPVALEHLDRALRELERAGVIASDFDDGCGERVYRMLSAARVGSARLGS